MGRRKGGREGEATPRQTPAVGEAKRAPLPSPVLLLLRIFVFDVFLT